MDPRTSLATQRQTRAPDRFVIHGGAIDFRELCRRAIPENTRYLVLDLDRTVHLGRNMGELLGFELAAWHAYGEEHLAASERRRRPGRFFIDWRRPFAALHYLLIGARLWAYPGLYYLVFGKLPDRFALGRRWMFRRLGTDPVSAAQSVPQMALLHQLTAISSLQARTLAQRVWDRHACDQVIEREDLAWLRARCPGIRIIIASASPQPTVAVAAAELGVDDVLYSTVEQDGDGYSAPYQLHPALSRHVPRRLSRPSQTRINSSRAKIENLTARYPELADPRTVSVGITDTGYGEDHCWLGHFTRVIDVNSSSPFPPFVASSSPLREIHSAAVLTRSERERRSTRDPLWLDPRRRPLDARDRVFTGDELLARLAPVADRLEVLARRRDECAAMIADARNAVAERFTDVMRRIEAVVTAFNDAAVEERDAMLAQLRRELRANDRVRRELARVERPLAELTCTMSGLLASARAALPGDDEGETRHRPA